MADSSVPKENSEKGKTGKGWLSCASQARIKVLVVIFLIFLVPLLEIIHVLVGANVHTLIPGKVYRCAQPTTESLANLIKRFGIKTVLNLRGSNPMMGWYQEEARATHSLNINQEDINFSAGRLPSSSEIRELIHVLDEAEYPILIHCRRGSDRTGLVASIVMLLKEDVDYSEARNYLSWRFGHLSLGRTVCLGTFFDIYKDWLREQHKEHSNKLFRYWALKEYRGGTARCHFEKITWPERPIQSRIPFSLAIRVHNTSNETWVFSPVPTAGVHLHYQLLDSQGFTVSTGRAGYFDARVQPGESIDLNLPVTAIPSPGTYHMVLDMVDEQMGFFFQMGSDPKELRLEVCE